MVELIVIGEGQTEEAFVNRVLAAALAPRGIYVTPRLVRTSSGQRGGALNLDRIGRFIERTLKERQDTYLTTLFDLYALDKTFPGVVETQGLPPADRAARIEDALHAHIALTGCRRERFLPYIQPHEFESLLFSDTTMLCQIEPEWAVHAPELAEVRAGVADPEWINDSPHTAPSKRLAILTPRYRKVRHGPLAAEKIGLDTIRAQCPHFSQWFDRIAALEPL
ncbi:DUF4276 family protein [Burkholderia guangdongensis]|uniref:DUF4276 family protein n=1 Tax=Burkholderia guangdongensis TaxID=1792500 RepID=UPI0015CBCA22|nr:DUF4276 family protein [Burkholderia guangdongensis]